MVTDYVTADDFGDESLLKKLIENGSVLEPSTASQTTKESSSKKGKNEFKNSSRV